MPDSPLLDHCPPTLPATAYFDPDWFAREQRAIFGREWVYAGRLADLRPGTLRRLRVGGDNLILCRAADGVVTAFHNTCRHRGAELCAEPERPLGRLITCPYHAWSYDTSGRLVSTAQATPTADFRRDEHGLFGVHVKEWNGFLYVCLAAEPPALAPDAGVTALDNWPMRELVTGHRLEKDLACNWKIFWENYNECLHCPGVHPQLCDLVPLYGRGIMAANEAADWSAALPVERVLKAGARTWTMDGKVCGPEFAHLSDTQRVAGHTFVTLYPTMFVVGHVDYVRVVSLLPLAPELTRLTAEWLFLPATLAQPRFDLQRVTDFATTVLLQDGTACETNQRGLRSSRYTSGRLMPQEFYLAGFHAWVLQRLQPAQDLTGTGLDWHGT